MWPARLRWRLRGAWLWPAFVVLTVVDGVLLDRLPIAGDGPDGIVPAVILAGFFNLAAVIAAFAFVPLVRRRRPDLPRPIAHNYVATALVVGVLGSLVAGGLIHRPARKDRERDVLAVAAALHDVIQRRADLAEYRPGVSSMDILRLTDDLYRACAPGPDPERHFCLVVNTDQDPPGIEIDSTKESNQDYRGPAGRP